jgi:hypothetical protein
VPAIYPYCEVTQADGLLSYGTNIADIVRQAGVMAGKVLKGAKPAVPPGRHVELLLVSTELVNLPRFRWSDTDRVHTTRPRCGSRDPHVPVFVMLCYASAALVPSLLSRPIPSW